MSPWEVLGTILQTLLKFVPRVWWCPTYVAGVMFVRGKHIVPFGAGRVVWFPLRTSMLTCPVVRQVLDIDPQTVTTQDGKSVIVAGVATYHISDHVTYLTENYETEHSLDEAIAASLREVIVDKTWEEVQANNRKTTDRALTKEAGAVLAEFGVTVERVRLTSLAQAKVINIIGDSLNVVPDEDEE